VWRRRVAPAHQNREAAQPLTRWMDFAIRCSSLRQRPTRTCPEEDSRPVSNRKTVPFRVWILQRGDGGTDGTRTRTSSTPKHEKTGI